MSQLIEAISIPAQNALPAVQFHNRPAKQNAWWPAIVLAFGLVLTVAWAGFLVLVLLYLIGSFW